jgi:hypothetical protein
MTQRVRGILPSVHVMPFAALLLEIMLHPDIGVFGLAPPFPAYAARWVQARACKPNE